MSLEDTNLFDDMIPFKLNHIDSDCFYGGGYFFDQKTADSLHQESIDDMKIEINENVENKEDIENSLSKIVLPESINEMSNSRSYDEKKEKSCDLENKNNEGYVLDDKCSCITVKHTTVTNKRTEMRYEEETFDESNPRKGRKKGRLRKRDMLKFRQKNYHSRNRKDNIKNKIKIHFINFIINFTNGIIKGKMFRAHNILFRQLPHSIKKDVNIQTNKLFLNETIKDILIKYGVSSKYKNKDESNIDSLEKITKKIERNEYQYIFNDYLQTTIKAMYNDFYYTNNIEEILNKYQINRDKVKKLKFLTELIDEYSYDDDKEYVKKFKKECNTFILDFENKNSRKKRE